MRSFTTALCILLLPAMVCAMASPGPLGGKALDAYIAAQEALAADNFAAAKTAMDALAASAEGEIEKLAADAAAVETIKLMRAAFKPLSEAVVKGDYPKGYAIAFCPMADNDKGAHWIQKDGKIMNPYFGSRMLHCGTFKKKF